MSPTEACIILAADLLLLGVALWWSLRERSCSDRRMGESAAYRPDPDQCHTWPQSRSSHARSPLTEAEIDRAVTIAERELAYPLTDDERRRMREHIRASHERARMFGGVEA